MLSKTIEVIAAAAMEFIPLLACLLVVAHAQAVSQKAVGAIEGLCACPSNLPM